MVAEAGRGTPPSDEDDTVPALNVPACPGSAADAVPATAEHCEVQPTAYAPGTSVRAQSTGTAYRVDKLLFDASALPGSAQIFNNHIPVDPVLFGAVAVTKSTPMVNVTRGALVPYTITATNTYPIELQDIGVIAPGAPRPEWRSPGSPSAATKAVPCSAPPVQAAARSPPELPSPGPRAQQPWRD